jgi:hypothetical protein
MSVNRKPCILRVKDQSDQAIKPKNESKIRRLNKFEHMRKLLPLGHEGEGPRKTR